MPFTGSADPNFFFGHGGADQVSGGAGDDGLSGGESDDVLNGGEGEDQLGGGTGTNSMTAGAGNDVYEVDSAADQLFEEAAGGTDEVRTGLASYLLAVEVENLTGTPSTGQVLTGNMLASVIRGGSGDDVLDGAGGDDRLFGGLANDLDRVAGGTPAANSEKVEVDLGSGFDYLVVDYSNLTQNVRTSLQSVPYREANTGSFLVGGQVRLTFTGLDRMT